MTCHWSIAPTSKHQPGYIYHQFLIWWAGHWLIGLLLAPNGIFFKRMPTNNSLATNYFPDMRSGILHCQTIGLNSMS